MQEAFQKSLKIKSSGEMLDKKSFQSYMWNFYNDFTIDDHLTR